MSVVLRDKMSVVERDKISVARVSKPYYGVVLGSYQAVCD